MENLLQKRLSCIDPSETVVEVERLGWNFKFICVDQVNDMVVLDELFAKEHTVSTFKKFQENCTSVYPNLKRSIDTMSVVGVEIEHQNSLIVYFSGDVGSKFSARFDGVEWQIF